MKEFLRKNCKPLFNFLKQARFLIYRFNNIIFIAGEGSYLVSICKNYTTNETIYTTLRYIVGLFRVFKYFFPSKINDPNRKGLAIVLIIKDEAQYILEWINFHGVSHFFIYDNESSDNLLEVLQPFIASGLVTYHKIPGKVRQLDAYNHAISKYKRKFKYFAMIDTDEFLFLRNNTEGGGGYIISLMIS